MHILEAPRGYPVSLQDAKQQCAILDDTHDSLLLGYISAATASVEKDIGALLFTQKVGFTLSGFPDAEIEIPVYPVQSVDLVEYIDPEGATVQMDALTDYWQSLQGRHPFICPVNGWPARS